MQFACPYEGILLACGWMVIVYDCLNSISAIKRVESLKNSECVEILNCTAINKMNHGILLILEYIASNYNTLVSKVSKDLAHIKAVQEQKLFSLYSQLS